MTAPWILLRGLMRDQRHWGHFPDQLGAAFPAAAVHRLDLPGNGRLNTLTSPDSVAAMVDHLRAERHQRGIRGPVRLLALSLGAMVAIDWAHRYPQEVTSAVLVNTSLRPYSRFYQRLRPVAWPVLLRLALSTPDPRVVERAVLGLTSNHHRDDAALLDQWVAWRQTHPVRRSNALRQMNAAIRYRAPPTAPSVPILILNGRGDRLVDPRCSERLAATWKAPLAQHPDAGHDLPLDAGAWVIEQLLRHAASR